MRRKIIKQGNNSYTFTLPVNWVREHEIDKGSEIDIVEEESNLVISLPKERQRVQSTTSINVKDYDERTVRNLLNQAYRKGFDKIIIENPSKEQLKYLEEITRFTLLGFDIIQGNGEYSIQSIAEPSSTNFDNILRKIFFSILEDSKEAVEDIEKGNTKNLKKFIDNRHIVDNYTNLCRRLIVKDRIPNNKDSYSFYTIISRLSLVYHAYFYMYKHIASQKNSKVNPRVIELLKKANDMFELFYKAFYSKEIETVHEIGTQKDKLLYEDIYELLQKSKGNDNIILYHTAEIIRLTHLLSTNLFGLVENEV